MVEAEIQVFSIALEVLFGRPRPYAKEKIDDLATWLTDPAEGFALRPEQVRVRHADLVFDYELSASFFGGNATFKRDAEKVVFSARGAKTRQDVEILQQTAFRFVNAVAMPEHLSVEFSANAHASLASEAVREAYLAAFRPNDKVVGPGALGFVRLAGWPEDIRIAIEPSLGLPHSLFFAWHTRFLPSADPLQLLQTLVVTLGKAAEVYGVNFKQIT
jgi:hypothetical protein